MYKKRNFTQNHKVMPLAFVETGRKVRFLGVKAGCGLRAKLAAMGMVPGIEIDMISNSRRGPVIISVMGNRIMLGRGIAARIRTG